jgi:hypothetical protein
MPCNDVTEVLSLTLDHEDRVIHYSLAKLTCGAAVGNPSLLRKWIDGRKADDVLRGSVHDVLAVLPTRSETWEYLTYKHLLAVQHGLRAVLGVSQSGPDDICAIQSIETDERGIKLMALVKVDLLTSEIEGCSNCSLGEH